MYVPTTTTTTSSTSFGFSGIFPSSFWQEEFYKATFELASRCGGGGGGEGSQLFSAEPVKDCLTVKVLTSFSVRSVKKR